jgi:hypothetical protein
MAIEARRCRESGRELTDRDAIFVVIDYVLGRSAVIDEETLRGISDSDRDYEGPFTDSDLRDFTPEQLGANLHQTVPAGQDGVVLQDDFMFAMWPNQLLRSLPNVSVELGYIPKGE